MEKEKKKIKKTNKKNPNKNNNKINNNRKLFHFFTFSAAIWVKKAKRIIQNGRNRYWNKR